MITSYQSATVSSLYRSLICLGFVLTQLGAEVRSQEESAKPEFLERPAGERRSNLESVSMPNLGEGRLPKILSRFYTKGLGGPETWDAVSSMRVVGSLELEGGTFALNGLQKKPDLIKLELETNNRSFTMAYDGETAWQQLPQPGSEPQPMGETEARRFVHSAIFGNYLVKPFASGKKIEFVDTVPMEGGICHHLRVHLDNGFEVNYFIDIRSYYITKVVNVDTVAGTESTVLYSDYVPVEGFPLARKAKSYENGQLMSTLTINEVRLNSGIVSWMFEMP